MKLWRAVLYAYRWTMRRSAGRVVADPEGETPGWVAVRETDGTLRRVPEREVNYHFVLKPSDDNEDD